MRPQSLSPPFRRSKTMACTAMGTLIERIIRPRPWPRRKEPPPPAASRPNSEPPESTTASMLVTVISGSSRAVSRLPGAPPRVTPDATFAWSKTTTVTPVATRASCAWPTRMPARSVIRLRRALKAIPPLQAALAQLGAQAAHRQRGSGVENEGGSPRAASREQFACLSVLDVGDFAVGALLPGVHHVVGAPGGPNGRSNHLPTPTTPPPP